MACSKCSRKAQNYRRIIMHGSEQDYTDRDRTTTIIERNLGRIQGIADRKRKIAILKRQGKL
jgi:hypothetical protein